MLSFNPKPFRVTQHFVVSGNSNQFQLNLSNNAIINNKLAPFLIQFHPLENHSPILRLYYLYCPKHPNTWWLIPLSKWVITPVINGISRVNPLITGVITHLLSGMSHQVFGSQNRRSSTSDAGRRYHPTAHAARRRGRPAGRGRGWHRGAGAGEPGGRGARQKRGSWGKVGG